LDSEDYKKLETVKEISNGTHSCTDAEFEDVCREYYILLGANPDDSRDVLDYWLEVRNNTAQGPETGLDKENIMTESGGLPIGKNPNAAKVERKLSERSADANPPNALFPQPD
jgi:hypothetical protein